MSEVGRGPEARREHPSQAGELLWAIVREIDTPLGTITDQLQELRARSSEVGLSGDEAAADRLIADIAIITDEMLAATRRIAELAARLRAPGGAAS